MSTPTLPASCITHGYAGYGDNPPRETVWSKHVGERLQSAGAFLVANPSTSASSGHQDTTLHTNEGIFFLEFKGKDTPVRGNQAATTVRYNAKSLYSRGQLVSFVYKAPDILGCIRADGTIQQFCCVDALLYPDTFVHYLHDFSQYIRKGTVTAEITDIVESLQLPTLPLKKFTYKGPNYPTGGTIWTYTKELALKQCSGLTPYVAAGLGISVDEYEVREDG